MYKEHITLGKFSQEELDHIIHKSSEIRDVGEQIDYLSGQFLGIDYAESTLIGNRDTPEVFVINLQGFDCFTFIEYIEAMRLSGSFHDFKSNLKKVRYRSGTVDFMNRNHFFTDWREFNTDRISDVTEEVGYHKTRRIEKKLNDREDGTFFLPGIQPVQRDVLYIPSDEIDDTVLAALKTGDYAGICSDLKGLDVSHVGIIIKDGVNVYLRHASSQKEYSKVIDQDFRKYLSGKPGIIVFRPTI